MRLFFWFMKKYYIYMFKCFVINLIAFLIHPYVGQVSLLVTGFYGALFLDKLEIEWSKKKREQKNMKYLL